MINIRRPDLVTTKEEKKDYIKYVEGCRILNLDGHGLKVRLPRFYCDLLELKNMDRVRIRIEKV